MKRVLILLALVVLVVTLTASAYGQEPPDTLCEALEMLGTAPLIAAAAGAAIAVALEYWPWWGAAAPKWKRPLVLGFCLALPVLSLVARVPLCGAMIDPDTIYRALLAGGTAFVTGQFAHIYWLPSKTK